MTHALVRGDALAISLADSSVDLVITSPPYFAQRSYRDAGEHYDGQIGAEPTPNDFLEALWGVTAECARVLKPTGSLWVNLGDKYAGTGGHNNAGVGSPRERGPRTYNRAGDARDKSLMGLPWRYAIGCMDRLGLILRAEVVWEKPNGMPESAGDRVRRSHEQWFHFTLEPNYFADLTEIRVPHRHAESPTARRGPSGQNRGTVTGRTHDDGGSVGNFNHDPAGRLPGSVWNVTLEPLRTPAYFLARTAGDLRPQAVPTDEAAWKWARHSGVDRSPWPRPEPDEVGPFLIATTTHFAAFPQEFPRRLILGWAPPGGVVLDPFGGTGTVAMVARTVGRFGLSFDLSADYLRLAWWRIEDSGHSAKSVRRTNEAAQGALL